MLYMSYSYCMGRPTLQAFVKVLNWAYVRQGSIFGRIYGTPEVLILGVFVRQAFRFFA